MFFSTEKTLTNDNNTPIDTTYVIQTPLNVAATDAADETTHRSLFGAGLYQTGSVSRTASGLVAVQTPPSVPSLFTQGLMPDKFDCKGFKTWQKKMMFFLTMMKLDKFIQEDKPLITYGIDDVHSLATVDI